MGIAKKDQYFQQLEEIRSELEKLAKSATNEQLNLQPEGKWSALQHMHHLILAESAIMQYIRKKMPHVTEKDKTGLSAALKLKSVRVALGAGYKAKAPAVTSEDIPEKSTFEEVKKAWDAGRADLQALISEIPEDSWELAIFKHPVAGRLNGYQALEFMEIHMNHHIKAIRKCLN